MGINGKVFVILLMAILIYSTSYIVIFEVESKAYRVGKPPEEVLPPVRKSFRGIFSLEWAEGFFYPLTVIWRKVY